MFHKRRRRKSQFFVLVVMALLFVCLSHWFDIDDKAHYMWINWSTSETRKQSAVWLPDYKADVQAVPIAEVDKNVSGITYNYERNTLWIITNQPQELIELTMDFDPIRKIVLKNFKDTEAVAYIGNDTFVIADEREHSIVVTPVTAHTTTLDKTTLRHITLKQGGSKNNGLEGIAYDAHDKLIYAVQERDPLKLISVSGLAEGKQCVSVGVPAHIDVDELNLDDLSGLHFDSRTGHLLVLSHEAKLLVEVDDNGHPVSYVDLESGFNGLLNDIPQAEGVTLDSKGNLYIVSEPNHIYRFVKK